MHVEPPEHESHSLEQLGKVMALYRRAEVSPRDALFLATQLVNHGYAEAGGVLDSAEPRHHERGRPALPGAARRCATGRFSPCPASGPCFADRDGDGEALCRPRATCSGVAQTRADTAVVIFTTMYNNYHFSNAVLDAVLSGLGVSRLFLKDTTKYMYLRGVKGLAEDLRDLPAALLGLLRDEGNHRDTSSPASHPADTLLSMRRRRMKPIGYVGYSIYHGYFGPCARRAAADIREDQA